MTIDQIRRVHQRKPFQPFDLHLADGRSIPVRHPEFLMLLPGGRTLVVGHDDGTAETVDVLLVTILKERRNGSSRRRKQS